MASDARVENGKSHPAHNNNNNNNHNHHHSSHHDDANGSAIGAVKSERPENKRSFSDTVQHVWNNITLEPLVVCFVMPSMLLMLGSSNLNLEKACRVNLAYTQTVCDSLTRRETANYTMEEREVQKLVALMNGWKSAFHSAVPIFIILFVGSWSDRHRRRKPCILIPLVGEIITAFGLLFCVYFEKTPVELAIFVEVFFPSITGGKYSMMIGIFSYLADVTTEKERTYRIGLISIVYTISVPFGMAFSGILLRQIGFYGVFTLSGIFYIIAFLYGLLYLKEVPALPQPIEMTKTKQAPDAVSQIPKKGIIADFFDMQHVYDTMRIAFKSDVKYRRIKVILTMVIVFIIFGPQHGEMNLFYLFTRYQFNWSEVEFSFFSAYSIVVHLVGTTFAMLVLSKMFKVHDAIIGAIAAASKVFSSYVFAFAVLEWHMFVGPVVEIMGGATFIAMRSIASKCVSKDELGKMNSLYSVIESISPLIYSPTLATIYSATISTMPGAFFLVGGTMFIPSIFMFAWLYIIHRREAAENAQLDTKINANDNIVGKGKADAVGTGLVGCDNQVFVISDEMNERI